tara:strand:+ start:854 stop:1651 length:798 start_codon:yes stop_codon:yes gene_type:complete
MSKTLLVITTYNQSDYTKLCFDSLKNIEEDIDVLVIDDCSADDTLLLCKEYGHKVIAKKEGKGLTDSWNRGYYEFKKTDDHEYLILANNDILIPNGALGELVETFQKWPFSMIVPMSTEYGVGHNREQSITNYYNNIDPSNPNDYQHVQDKIIDIKKKTKDANNLYICDPVRMKMFNGFFFMMNRNIINYQHSDKELFEPKNIMTKNEDEFNWSKLIPNNDFTALCKTSFIFHYKGVSTFEVFDNYNKIANDIPEWKRQREGMGG